MAKTKSTEKQEKKTTKTAKKVDESLNENVVSIETTEDDTEIVDLEAENATDDTNLESVNDENAGDNLEKELEPVNGDPSVLEPEGDAINEELTAEKEIGYQNGGPGTIVEGDMTGGFDVSFNATPVDLMNKESFMTDIETRLADPYVEYQRETPHYVATNAKDCRVWDDATPDYVAQCPPKKDGANPNAYVAQRPY